MIQKMVRERAEKLGVNVLSNVELLTLIIGDDGAANAVMNEVKDINALCQMSIYRLMQIDGIGQAKAMAIRAALELGMNVMRAHGLEESQRITSPASASSLLTPMLINEQQEHLVVICLDTRNQVKRIVPVYKGSLNSSVIRIAEIFKAGIENNSAAIIVAHNHPSGDPSPSPEDIHVTKQIVKAGKLLDIELLDHIIIGRNSFVSLKERGLGFG